MRQSLSAESSPREVCDVLRQSALNALQAKRRLLRLTLQFQARGKCCRLFYAHGPKGHVLERLTNADGESVTIAEFDAVEVLDATMEKLGL